MSGVNWDIATYLVYSGSSWQPGWHACLSHPRDLHVDSQMTMIDPQENWFDLTMTSLSLGEVGAVDSNSRTLGR